MIEPSSSRVTKALWLGAALSLAPLPAGAGPHEERTAAAQLEKRLPGAKIQSVRETPVRGLYEVAVDRQMFYADSSARCMFERRLERAK